MKTEAISLHHCASVCQYTLTRFDSIQFHLIFVSFSIEIIADLDIHLCKYIGAMMFLSEIYWTIGRLDCIVYEPIM